MAVVRVNSKASIRMTDTRGRADGSLSGLRPNVTAADVSEVVQAFAMLRQKGYTNVYLNVSHELEDHL